MKKLTERDKTLAMLMPALTILLVFGLFFVRGKAGELKRANDVLAKAKAPNQAEMAAKLGERARVIQETNALQEKLVSLQKKWGYETGFCASGCPRHDRVEKLTNLLNKHHLTSMEDSEAEAGGKDTKVSPSLDSLIQKIGQLSSAQKPQLRRIKFNGRFADVHHALEELATGEMVAIPVGLTMKTTDDPDRREWTLLVWL
jgi:hypothetical protein